MVELFMYIAFVNQYVIFQLFQVVDIVVFAKQSSKTRQIENQVILNPKAWCSFN